MSAPSTTDYDSYIHEPNNRELDHIPGEYGLPIIGQTIPFLRDPYEWAKRQHKKFGLLSRVNTAGSNGVLALGPDLMQQIMLDPGRDFSSKMGFMDNVSKFFSDSLIMEDFEHHKHQRRILQAAFKNDALKTYTSDINRIYDRALSEWSNDSGQTILFFDYIKNLLLQVAAEIFVGETERGERVEKLNQAFSDCVAGTMYMVPYNIPGTRLHKGLKGKAYLEKFFTELVPRKRNAANMDGEQKGQDMLSHVCREKDEEGDYYTDKEIANQMIFLLFAAHDTTTAAITHTIYYLARNPEIKQKLYDECLAVGKDSLEHEDLNSVPYMQQVFNEVQRLRPSAPMVPRRTIREVDMLGHRVPAHTMVYIFPRFSHCMPEYWSQPERFDPDRFSPKRAEHKQHPFLFHPFGGGAHKCIGMHFSQMEYKCFIYKFILNFDFESQHRKEPKMMTLPIPRPSDKMPIKLMRR